MQDPSMGFGARPFSEGIPKIAILITDGQSNLFPIEPYATQLRESGVQVCVLLSIAQYQVLSWKPGCKHGVSLPFYCCVVIFDL